MKKLLFIPLLFISFMPGTGDTFPNSGTNNNGIGATAWTLPSEITADDASDATCNAGASSQYLVASSFNFSLPAGAVINGITVKIEASEHSPSTEVFNAQLQDASGALFGSSKTVSVGGINKTVYTYGSSSDVWGATITKAIVEDADFGVRFWFTTQHDVRVDYVTIDVQYSVYTKKGQFFQFFTQSKSSNTKNSL